MRCFSGADVVEDMVPDLLHDIPVGEDVVFKPQQIQEKRNNTVHSILSTTKTIVKNTQTVGS
jgi:hypothetical protein